MNPYLEQDIVVRKQKNPRKLSIGINDISSAVSFDSVLTPKAPRLRAATMMMETKTIKKKAPPTMSPRDISPIARIEYVNNSKAAPTLPQVKSPIAAGAATLKLPDLANKTVSHSMVPPGSKLILDDLDLKLKDQLAKNSFMRVDESAMRMLR